MPALRPENREARRDAILGAAMRCFAREGYRGTSMRDICKEAGLSIGGIYVHFASKEDILTALAEMFQSARDEIHKDVVNGPTTASTIGRTLRAMTADYDTEEGAFALHADVVMLGEALNIPVLKRVLVDTDHQHFDAFRDILRRGALGGRDDLSGLSQFVTGSLFGLIILSAYHKDFDRQGYIDILETFLAKLESNSGRDIGRDTEGVKT